MDNEYGYMRRSFMSTLLSKTRKLNKILQKSGTEPVIRVMVEGENEQEVKALAQHLANAVKNQADVLVEG